MFERHQKILNSFPKVRGGDMFYLIEFPGLTGDKPWVPKKKNKMILTVFISETLIAWGWFICEVLS